MKKILAILVVILVVVALGVEALGKAIPKDPIFDAFEQQKESIQQVDSKSNYKLKKKLVKEIETFKNDIFVYDFKVYDSFLKVKGEDIFIVTLEKLGTEMYIVEYDIYVPPASSLLSEEDIAKMIVSGEKIPNISDFSFTASEEDIRMYPADPAE